MTAFIAPPHLRRQFRASHANRVGLKGRLNAALQFYGLTELEGRRYDLTALRTATGLAMSAIYMILAFLAVLAILNILEFGGID
ncbi:MAG: hypothetical protein AAGL49_02895 [Pseudomonadota bacterium]